MTDERADDELTEAVREWDEATKERTRRNQAAKQASEAVQQKKQRVLQLLDAREQTSVGVDTSLVSAYTMPFFHVADRAAFTAWAKKQDETYFEDELRVRTETFNRDMQELYDNKQPLPPGVTVYEDRRVSKRKAAARARRRR